MTSNTFQEAIELVEFASTPPSVLPTKETKDPFDLVTRTLCDKILSSSFNTLFQNLQLEPLPCTSTGTENDARLHYSDALRFILSIFCTEASTAVLPIDDWTALSSKQIEAIIRTFEMLVAMSILPSIDQGIGVPLEKRVTFVKIWKPFLDDSQRIQQLQKTLQIFQRLCEINEGLKIQLISKFLPDFISANEQLINLRDTSLKSNYDSFLQKMPLSVIMKEFLLLYGGFGLSGRKAMAPAWFVTSISKKLSEALASPKGLSNLLYAFDELGGGSFWNNTVALSSVATLLSTKPQHVESYSKYTLSMFSQFLDVMKNSKFGSNVSLLFVLTVDKLYAKAPRIVEVQLVDKIIRPWELLLERGIQNPLTKENGYWNANLDGSLVILRSWLNAQPQQYSIKNYSFAHRFLKLVPLFMHFCGQAAAFEELKEFSDDLSLILIRLLNDDLKESEVLLKYMLNDGNKTQGFFKISSEIKSPVSEVKEGTMVIKYPVNLEIVEDPLDEEMLLDFKIDAFRLIVKALPSEVSIKCIVVLMSDCLNAWICNYNTIQLDDDSLRFVPELKKHVAEHSLRMKAVYILCSVVEILTSIETGDFPSDILPDMIGIAMKIFVAANQRLSSVMNVEVLEEQNNELKTIEAQTSNLAVGLVSAVLANAMNDDSLKYRLQEVSDASFIDLYKSTFESSVQLLELFSNDLNLDVSAPTHDFKNISLKSNKHSFNKIQKWKSSLEDDDEVAVKGGVLIEMSSALRRKDKNIFSNANDFEWVWKVALENAINTDSYVFLASINVLAELSYWQADIFLSRLVECFTNWDESNLSKDVSIMSKCKIGEALAKVFKQIGNFSAFYFDQFSNQLLHLSKTGDELIRSSALSSFADLIVACRGRKYDSMIQELLLLVSEYLKHEDSALIRRSAVHLLRCLLTSADDNLLTTFSDTIHDVHRMLKRLWLQDQDDVVRFHAELALIDLKSIMQRLFQNIMDNNSDNKENCEIGNNLSVHNAVDYEIKHRDVHVADWSHEIGDQHVIDSHDNPYKSTISVPSGPKPPRQRRTTFTRRSNNQQNRNHSRNQNRQPGVQSSNSQNYEPSFHPSSEVSQRRSYVHPSQNRQSSAHSQSRNRQQPPVFGTNVQASCSATTTQTFTLLTRNTQSNVAAKKVTIESTSNDVRLDTKFMNGNQPFIPRHVFPARTDNAKPHFHQKDGQYNKQRNDQPKTFIKTVTPSTSQIFKKQIEKPYRKSPPKKITSKACQSFSKEKVASGAYQSISRMPVPSCSSVSKEKTVLPSTFGVNVKEDQKVPEAPKPAVKKTNPFGNARPVDTHKKMIEIEQKKLDEQKKLNEEKKLEEEKKMKEEKIAEGKSDEQPINETPSEEKKLKDGKKMKKEKKVKKKSPFKENSELSSPGSNRIRRNSF